MNQSNNSRSAGFTIVELTIAMAFVALLLLAIAATVIQIGSIYNKGVTMKSVNQSGRLVVADIKRITAESSPFDIPTTYRHHKQGSQDANEFDAGRLCLSTYSYIWNIGKYIKESPDSSTPPQQVYSYSDDAQRILHFVRVRNNGVQYCRDDSPTSISSADATELISDDNLAVQDFRIEKMTNNLSSGRALYSLSIIISDAENGAIDSVSNTCNTPDQDSAYQYFCAVNQFEFTAQAGKGGE